MSSASLAVERRARGDERRSHRIGASHKKDAGPLQCPGELLHELVVVVPGMPAGGCRCHLSRVSGRR